MQRWVIDDLFPPSFKEPLLLDRSQEFRGPNCTKLGEDIEQSSAFDKLLQISDTLLRFEKSATQRWLHAVENRGQISDFSTP